MTKRKSADTTNANVNEEIVEELGIFEDTNLATYRKAPRLIIKHKVLQARKNKKLIFEIDLCSMIRDGKLSLEKFFLQLQVKAAEHSITLFQIPMDSNIFNMCTIERFKIIGRHTLKTCKIAITNAITRVSSWEEQLRLLQKFHNDPLMGGHCGKNRLHAKLRSSYYWKGISKDVKNLVKTCEKCQLNKIYTHTKEKIKITETPQKPFDILIIDTIGPISKSAMGNQYAVTLICDLTKHLTIIPIPNKEARTVVKAIFENFILTFSVMRNMRTDMGTEYRNEIFKALTQLLNIQHDFSTPYHHESVGSVERSHRVLNAYLRSYLHENNDDWDLYAKYFQFCYNTTPNSSNEHNYTPFELVFGRRANLPIEKFEKIEPIYTIDNYIKELKFRLQTTNLKTKEILTKYKMKMKERFDKNTNEIILKIGDSVKIRDETGNKLSSVYKGQ